MHLNAGAIHHLCTPSGVAATGSTAGAGAAPAASARARASGTLLPSTLARAVKSACFSAGRVHCAGRPLLLQQKFISSSTALNRSCSAFCNSVKQAAMAAPTQISANKCFGGYNRRYKHASSSLSCDMTFTVYFPPAADETAAAPSKVGSNSSADHKLASPAAVCCTT